MEIEVHRFMCAFHVRVYIQTEDYMTRGCMANKNWKDQFAYMKHISDSKSFNKQKNKQNSNVI